MVNEMSIDKNINDELMDIINENLNKIDGVEGIQTADESRVPAELRVPVEGEVPAESKAPTKKTRTIKAKAKKQEPEPKPDERSIEELFSELDGIIGKLESGDISLEDSFRYYEAGMKLVKDCSGKIDKVEKQIQVLNGSVVEE